MFSGFSAGLGFDWRLTPDLPSWAPNFAGASKAHSRRYIEPFAIFDSKLDYNDRDLWAEDMPHTEGPIPYCKAILVDEVHSHRSYASFAQASWQET
jgi:hypothetical protein